MPTYGYRCEKNGHEFEVVQGINDPQLTRCRVCGSRVRRIFYPVGVVFKGPGFYKTDSRAGSGSGIAAAERADSDSKESTDKPATAKKAEAKKSKSDSSSKSDSGSKSDSRARKSA